MKLREMDEGTTYLEQLQEGEGQVVLINQFEVPPEDAERFLEVWADDAAFMKRQPGFISTSSTAARPEQHVHQPCRLGRRGGARSGLPCRRDPCPRLPVP